MRIRNIYYLGVKELISLRRDPVLIGLIVFAFTIIIYSVAVSLPDTLHNAPISIVDEDQSQLSKRIVDAFYPPYFRTPTLITFNEIDERLNAGLDIFSIIIPTEFEQDVHAGKKPAILLNIDATKVSQALTGNEYIQQIITGEVNTFLQAHRTNQTLPIDVPFRIMFNPELKESWFGSVMQFINSITMLSTIITGAALIREREHGTVEHLLVMPVTSSDIMLSKIGSMAFVVLVCASFSLEVVIRLIISMPIVGSLFLFMTGTLFFLFATTSLGIFLATFARSMPQFAILVILVLLPMQILSGSFTPRESMPVFIQEVMLITPNTHFVMLAQAILYRGADFSIVWPQFLALLLIGAVLFSISIARFRKVLALMV